jgi:hypothetical protein
MRGEEMEQLVQYYGQGFVLGFGLVAVMGMLSWAINSGWRILSKFFK